MNEIPNHSTSGRLEDNVGIDALIRETLERRALLADLDHLIISDVCHQARLARVRRWAYAVVFSFAMPMALIVVFACAFLYILNHGLTAITLVVVAWPSLALIFSFQRVLNTFSPEDM